jgi:hypothetical protein
VLVCCVCVSVWVWCVSVRAWVRARLNEEIETNSKGGRKQARRVINEWEREEKKRVQKRGEDSF